MIPILYGNKEVFYYTYNDLEFSLFNGSGTECIFCIHSKVVFECKSVLFIQENITKRMILINKNIFVFGEDNFKVKLHDILFGEVVLNNNEPENICLKKFVVNNNTNYEKLRRDIVETIFKPKT